MIFSLGNLPPHALPTSTRARPPINHTLDVSGSAIQRRGKNICQVRHVVFSDDKVKARLAGTKGSDGSDEKDVHFAFTISRTLVMLSLVFGPTLLMVFGSLCVGHAEAPALGSVTIPSSKPSQFGCGAGGTDGGVAMICMSIAISLCAIKWTSSRLSAPRKTAVKTPIGRRGSMTDAATQQAELRGFVVFVSVLWMLSQIFGSLGAVCFYEGEHAEWDGQRWGWHKVCGPAANSGDGVPISIVYMVLAFLPFCVVLMCAIYLAFNEENLMQKGRQAYRKVRSFR